MKVCELITSLDEFQEKFVQHQKSWRHSRDENDEELQGQSRWLSRQYKWQKLDFGWVLSQSRARAY